MKWKSWALLALLLAGVTALYTLAPDQQHNDNSNLTSQPEAASINQSRTIGRQQEQKLKQMMKQRDITATERLSRLDAKRHLQQLAKQYTITHQSNGSPSYAKDLQKDHLQFLSIIWVKDGQSLESKASSYKLEPQNQKQLRAYLQYAQKAILKKQAYESPSFPQDQPKYYVVAEPSGEGKSGIIAVMDMSILKSVEAHQDKNLRLIPYPKEGKYRVESVHADTKRDITVKTGHDNEKASHYYENEIVVTFTEPPSTEALKQITEDLQCAEPKRIANTYIFRSEAMSMEQLKSYFQRKWKPKYVEPHYLYMTNDSTSMGLTDDSPLIPNDVLFSEYQWNLPVIETNRAWKLSRGSDDVIVAVVDTGVDLRHPDLNGRLLKGYNAIQQEEEPYDDVGHGTHVAGIIAANVNNNEGIAGMMWGGKVLPVKALDNSGEGTTYSVAQGIIWATDHGAKVINLSLGNYADAEFLHEAVKYAYNRDVVLIAATGNDNTERPGYPAAYPEVLAVSATDYQQKRAAFSNYGDYVDVMAPGESIASTYPDNQYAALSGTSMACPHVTALAALIRSVNPDLRNTEVMDLIRSNVIDLGPAGRDKDYGYGQIDVYSALSAAGAGDSALQLWPQAVQRKINRIINKHN